MTSLYSTNIRCCMCVEIGHFRKSLRHMHLMFDPLKRTLIVYVLICDIKLFQIKNSLNFATFKRTLNTFISVHVCHGGGKFCKELQWCQWRANRRGIAIWDRQTCQVYQTNFLESEKSHDFGKILLCKNFNQLILSEDRNENKEIQFMLLSMFQTMSRVLKSDRHRRFRRPDPGGQRAASRWVQAWTASTAWSIFTWHGSQTILWTNLE